MTKSSDEKSLTAAPANLEGKAFLYVGGRDCQVAHLREIACGFGVELIHHDGGLREKMAKIGNLMSAVAGVFCPIDCISHSAVTMVKANCKKNGKAFIPLRSGSKSTFERTLLEMRDGNYSAGF